MKEKLYAQYTLSVHPAVYVMIKEKLKKARWLSIMCFNTPKVFSNVNAWPYIFVLC